MANMSSLDEAITVLDLLDLEESVIDVQLNKFMIRKSLTIKNLNSIKQLLQYKLLLNTKEEIDSDNEKEFNFVIKLIEDLRPDNIEFVCKIAAITLSLSKESIVFKSEHLLQQVLANFNDLHDEQNHTSINNGSEKITLNILYLQVCESIIDLILSHGKKLSLPFLNISFEKIFQDKNLQLHFLSHTVPKLLEGLIGYNVLDKIWNHIEQLNGDHKVTSLNVLCHLSGYYLPIPDVKGNIHYRSNVVKFNKFWDIILYGLMSNNGFLRKMSIYLNKRAIDCLMHMKINLCIKLDKIIILEWNNTEVLKNEWDSYFILMESLEEKQSTIVLPSLQLFEHLPHISYVWLQCLYKLGLEHINFQVKINCINQRITKCIESELEAEMLLKALNDHNIYCGYEAHIKNQMNTLLMDSKSLLHILNTFPKINWSPVPLYHLIHIVCSLPGQSFETIGPSVISKIVIDILNIPCNHLIIRKAVHIDLLTAFCQFFELHDCMNLIIPMSKYDTEENLLKNSNFYDCIQKRFSEKNRDHNIEHTIFQNPNIIELGLIFTKNETSYNKLLEKVSTTLERIHEVIKQQYCSRRECLNDVIFILTLFHKLSNKNEDFNYIKNLISNEHTVIWQYVITLLTEDTTFHYEEIVRVFEGLKSLNFTDNSALDILKNGYKMSHMLLKEKTTKPDKKVISICIIKSLMENNTIHKLSINDMVKHNNLMEITRLVSFQSCDVKYDGKLRNMFNEKACEIVSLALYSGYKDAQIKEIITFIEVVLERGGHGCLKWILKILNYVLPSILHDINDLNVNINSLFQRMWKEIDEIKFNSQYSICIEEFVKLITHNCFIENVLYNNMILNYCNEIVKNGSLRKVPLYFLAKEVRNKIMTLGMVYTGPMLNVFCEILQYAPVKRKDQRIVEKLICEIISNSKYEIDKQSAGVSFNIDIQLLAVEALSSLEIPEVLENIANFMMKKIDETFKNKTRYHANSQAHNTLLITLQHLLFIQLLNSEMIDLQTTQNWCLNLLAKLPHQPNVRACLEWIIALNYYRKKHTLCDLVIKELKSANVPLASQFLIIYLIAKQKIINKLNTNEENEFVMDFLLAHSMGQIYNIRLHAQYLALKVYQAAGKINKYSYCVNIIKNTFSESGTDKNFLRLQQDYFANDFDIIGNLTPSFIYYVLPRYNEIEVLDYVDNIVFEGIELINKSLTLRNVDNNFTKEWKCRRKPDCDIFGINFHKKEDSSQFTGAEEIGTIQKKYIPWRNMTELDTFTISIKNNKNMSDLIVVASLVDKLPNLGGMARTTEIFGVKKYVIDSKQHLQDKQFQGLSVSAERWLEIEEVKPGPALKKYLMDKKNEGYSIVAAEQTSNSIVLQSFKFPMKTLLLLGHEKEGVPCDLLPLMDYCVEIPQQGFIRSLNVHVTASIFIWEYSRQNLLKK